MLKIGTSSVNKIFIGSDEVNKAYLGNTLVYSSGPTPHDYSKDYLTFKIISGGTIRWRATITSLTKTIYYRVNDGEWTAITSTTGGTILTFNDGDIAQFKGDGAITTAANNANRFRDSTIVFEVYGNIMSLIDSTGYTTATTAADHSFRSLFAAQTGLISAENLVLPATTIGTNVYKEMFKGCTSLTKAPSALPAPTLAQSCYNGMFSGCTSLTTVPELPASGLAQECYKYMFRDCTSLTGAPIIIGTSASTVGVSGCTDMFRACTSLIQAPEMPATAVTGYSYSSMFSGCTSLEVSPVLPVKTLANYCYSNMFQRCSNLRSITCLATDISANRSTLNWTTQVSGSGIFYKDATMNNWTIGSDGIPTGWVTKNYDPITAITLTNLTWVTDVPSSGGTVDSGNCSFEVYAYSSGGTVENITSEAIISGSLSVSATTATTREMVGTLTLTASYLGFTDSDTVDVYQKAYNTAPVSIITQRTYFDIGYTGSPSTKLYIKLKPHTGGCGMHGAAASDYRNTYIIGKSYSAGRDQFSINCYYNSTASTETKFNFRYYAGNSYNDYFIRNCNTEEIYEATLSATGCSVSGGGVSSSTTFSSTYTGSPIYILGGDNDPQYNGLSGVITFYDASIYENDVLVKNYIPWEDNGHGCIKETISDTIIHANDPTKCIPNYA